MREVCIDTSPGSQTLGAAVLGLWVAAWVLGRVCVRQGESSGRHRSETMHVLSPVHQ